jgi:hypothetical protein
MYIMTGFTLSLFEGKMDITLGKSPLKLFMAVIAEVRNPALNACLSMAKTAPC